MLKRFLGYTFTIAGISKTLPPSQENTYPDKYSLWQVFVRLYRIKNVSDYLLFRRVNSSQRGNDGEGDVVDSRSGSFLIAIIAAVIIV
jgi:hypothetical protein